MAGRRMDDEARRLVEGEEMLVLEQHGERHLLGRHLAPLGERRQGDLDLVAQGQPARRLRGRVAVDPHPPLRDPGLEAGAGDVRPVGQVAPQDVVEPLPGVAAVGAEGAGFG